MTKHQPTNHTSKEPPHVKPLVQPANADSMQNPQPFAVAPQHINQSQQQSLTQSTSKGSSDTLGIVSIILAFFVPLAGLIVGIIGYKQAKRDYHSTGLSIVGIIISSLYMLLTLTFILIFFGIGLITSTFYDRARDDSLNYDSGYTETGVSSDLQAKEAINAFSAELEAYRIENGYYPSEITLRSDPSGVLVYLDNQTIERFTGGYIRYTPELCTERGCAAYTVGILLSDGTQYTKTSLNSL